MTRKQARKPGSPIAKPTKAVSHPTVAQLERAADRAREAGVPALGAKYDKIAADTAILKDAEHAAKTADEAGDAKLDAEARAALIRGGEASGDELMESAKYKLTRNQPTKGEKT